MSSRHSASNNDSSRWETRTSEPPAPAPRPPENPVNQAALAAALQETLAAGTGDTVSPDELNALVDVAARHAGQPLVLEPIAVEMVETIVRRRFGHLGGDDAMWRAAAREIATALFDAPQAQARLEQLWRQLAELVK